MFAAIPFATLYIGSFAFVGTLFLALLAYLMIERKKREGVPVNVLLLRVIGALTAGFWAISSVPYLTT